jgi:DNA uptake protein ComE-like DNA-binding protein
MRSDHKALFFIGVIAVLGAGVRVVRASASDSRETLQPALDRQERAADSAATAARHKQQSVQPRRQGRGRGARAHPSADSAKRVRDSLARANVAPVDRRGYVGGKLDLDIATLAQIDSLPGVTPLMARRVVLDRMAHGPFVTRDGLRRVSGVGQVFLSKIDSLITFSGTVKMPSAADTTPARVGRGRARGP